VLDYYRGGVWSISLASRRREHGPPAAIDLGFVLRHSVQAEVGSI
jgi:hypothetical protein